MKIQMVDVRTQYEKIKDRIHDQIDVILSSGAFINGPAVNSFEQHLTHYLEAAKVIPCGNGTDALQIALMAIDAKPGDEVIVPAFTYVATAEVIGLLGLKPVMVDVDIDTFNTSAELIEPYITDRTKAIVPVHLFGQSCDMDPIMNLAEKHHLFVIEDNAQSLGCTYQSNSGGKKTGTIGHIGCTSFYPSKNLGAYGDGGAISTMNESLGAKLKMIANHGQSKRYYHDRIGVNSRLDSIQAAVLDIKLENLDEYNQARNKVADQYDSFFSDKSQIACPVRSISSDHVFHQYTIKVPQNDRDDLKAYLADKGIPSMIYYPLPLYQQKAFRHLIDDKIDHLSNTALLCEQVLSLPIHTEMPPTQVEFIADHVRSFFK